MSSRFATAIGWLLMGWAEGKGYAREAALAARACDLIGEDRAALNTQWGLDHGTWSILRWMFPQADVPVVQLSIDRNLSAREHLALGSSLAPLREEGVLILGSGNITHNLPDAFGRMRAKNEDTPSWARQFDNAVTDAVSGRDDPVLASLWPDTENGRLAHPTPDHFFPLLYVYGATDERDTASFPITGFDLGSLSMRSVLFS